MNDPRYIPGTSQPIASPADAMVMRWPSWMDATFQLTAAQVKTTFLPAQGLTSIWQIVGNSRRWAIGFFSIGAPGPNLIASPEGFPALAGFHIVNTIASAWFKVFTYGPLVALPWVLQATEAGDAFVCEIELQ